MVMQNGITTLFFNQPFTAGGTVFGIAPQFGRRSINDLSG
jgi:hypothetical protein